MRSLCAVLPAMLLSGCSLAGGIDGDVYDLAVESIDVPIAQTDQDATDDFAGTSLDNCVIGDAVFKDAAGLQWLLPLPRGARVSGAILRVRGKEVFGTGGMFTVSIAVEDVNDATPFDDGPLDDVHMRAYWPDVAVAWDIPKDGLTLEAWHDSPDIAQLVQHVVDRGDWQEGHRIGFGIQAATGSDAGGTNMKFYDYADEPASAARLVLSWTPP